MSTHGRDGARDRRITFMDNPILTREQVLELLVTLGHGDLVENYRRAPVEEVQIRQVRGAELTLPRKALKGIFLTEDEQQDVLDALRTEANLLNEQMAERYDNHGFTARDFETMRSQLGRLSALIRKVAQSS